MPTTALSALTAGDLTKSSRQAIAKHILLLLKGPFCDIDGIADPVFLQKLIETRFGEVLNVEIFSARRRTGIFITFPTPASRNEFVEFAMSIKDPKDPLYPIQGATKDEKAYAPSFLPLYHIPLSLEKILASYGFLQFGPSKSSASSAAQYRAPKHWSTINDKSVNSPTSTSAKLTIGTRSLVEMSTVTAYHHEPHPAQAGISSAAPEDSASTSAAVQVKAAASHASVRTGMVARFTEDVCIQTEPEPVKKNVAELIEELRQVKQKVEALTAQFSTVPERLIAAGVRQESLGKRKRQESDDGETVV
ncbi:uncharacterized protein EI90DRAFT_967516 [Cantharellus anzutake]|uniref:uncharacterized protein n=1 Tax=Cantharellus anzutake TaxID=1750568 RepID=UPI00190672FD|nr:uncharacterized protein EI90DRAFT_967516 [Cantharellus anzutake]KAF8311418.1 hypothetical protein EI90DRAFT_967516 [Cantharellus anzutake]